MVKMRLKRMGQKKAPFYRIVVADSRSQEMEDSSRSGYRSLTQSQAQSRSMRKQLRVVIYRCSASRNCW